MELGRRFALPLALGPMLSMACVLAASWPVGFAIRRWAGRCVCVVERAPAEVDTGAAALATPAMPNVALVSDSMENCQDAGSVAAVTTTSVTGVVHWASGGFVGFARGWNDAPKIAALGIGALTAAESPHATECRAVPWR